MNEPVVMSKDQLESYRDSVAEYSGSKVGCCASGASFLHRQTKCLPVESGV